MMFLAKAKIAAVVALAIGLTCGAGVALVDASAPTTRRVATTAPAERARLRLVLDLDIGNDRPEFARLAPYTAIRWNGEATEAQVGGVWYELLAIDDVEMNMIVDFAKTTFGDLWQKRIAEDIVEVLSGMGREPREKVALKVRNLGTNETSVMEAAMTRENRQRVYHDRIAQGK